MQSSEERRKARFENIRNEYLAEVVTLEPAPPNTSEVDRLTFREMVMMNFPITFAAEHHKIAHDNAKSRMTKARAKLRDNGWLFEKRRSMGLDGRPCLIIVRTRPLTKEAKDELETAREHAINLLGITTVDKLSGYKRQATREARMEMSN